MKTVRLTLAPTDSWEEWIATVPDDFDGSLDSTLELFANGDMVLVDSGCENYDILDIEVENGN